MNPGDEAQAPICCVQADETGMDLVEADGPRSQAFGERSIMGMRRKKQKEDGEP